MTTGLIYTVGHSTRSFQDLVTILHHCSIELLCDIRTLPGSRRLPQFNKSTLELTLPPSGIEYIHLKELGGLRHAGKDSSNRGWRNASFRGYADYMETAEFAAGLDRLLELASDRLACLMCAEAVPWRCHRALVADAISVRGWRVLHIIDQGAPHPHVLTSFARVDGLRISYPPPTEQV
ncbi:MAG: DNA repair protein [Candidatus Nephthysia bennettiae]|nr:MAG: DNA repair protein [Candidatus Dormibacteraeota bacterium]